MMPLALTLVAFACLTIAVVAVAALIAWHPHGPEDAVLDLEPVGECEHIVTGDDGARRLCGAPAPFELGALSTNPELVERARAGKAAGMQVGAGTVVAYCAAHAPADAVRV
jgi:hypothetical protein